MHLRLGPSTFPRHLRIAALMTTVVALIALLEVAVIGAADPVLTFMEFHKDGVGGVDGLDFAMSVTVSPDGKHLYATSQLDDAVAVFSRNSTMGALTFVEVQRDGVGGVDGLDFARSVTVSPDGKHVYAAGAGDDAVAVFSRNTTTGALTFVEVQKDGVGGVDGLFGAWSVTVSPDGKTLYAAGAFDDAVAVFSRNTTTGALTFVEVQKDGVGGVDGLNGAYSVSVSPDGKHLYAAGAFDDAVAVFSRNSTTGALTFVEVQKDGVGGVDGLDLAVSVTVSPDGKHLYAAGAGDDAVAVLSRNSTTGALTFVEFHKDGAGGVDGLDGAATVTVSPDGKHLYAAGALDDAVAVFTVLSKVNIPLVVGFNLVARPVDCASPMNAKDLTDRIVAQGGVVDSIQRWGVGGSQGFGGWLPGAPNPFTIELGHGYFVKLSALPANGELSIAGLPCTQSAQLDFLGAGFNLVGVPFATPAGGYDSKTLSDAIVAAGGAVDSVQRWGVGGSQGFEGWLPGSSNPFTIDAKFGYFIKLSKVPTATVSP